MGLWFCTARNWPPASVTLSSAASAAAMGFRICAIPHLSPKRDGAYPESYSSVERPPWQSPAVEAGHGGSNGGLLKKLTPVFSSILEYVIMEKCHPQASKTARAPKFCTIINWLAQFRSFGQGSISSGIPWHFVSTKIQESRHFV